jgi:hypothetical protein
MFHTELETRWNSFSIHTQMANIGAEIGRAAKWKEKSKNEMSLNALYRALELIDFTIADPKNESVLKELCRIREVACDYIVGENIYKSTLEGWDKYFYPYSVAARKANLQDNAG